MVFVPDDLFFYPGYTLLDTAKYYNLPLEKAKNNATRIAAVVMNNWRRLAKLNGCSASEIERMQPAFEDKFVTTSIKIICEFSLYISAA